MQRTVLEVNHVFRDFKQGRVHAVQDLSFSIASGEILAIVGINGAGKTTTVKMCSTLLTPTSGSIRINGYDTVVHAEKARHGVGLVLGGDKGFYARSSVSANMRFFADVAGVSYHNQRSQIAQLLDRVGLGDKAKDKVYTLSRGQRQRLHVARALLGDPQLLLLDEPTVGLDPDAALQMRDLIRKTAAQNIGILLTSHSMQEVEELADRILIINSGKICVQGILSDIYHYAHISAVSTFSLPPSKSFEQLDICTWFADEARVLCRAAGTRWKFTVLWRKPQEQPKRRIYEIFREHVEESERAEQSDRSGLKSFEGEGSQSHSLFPSDIENRPTTLEDAFLAIAQDPTELS